MDEMSCEKLVQLYRGMQTIRLFEQAAYDLSAAGRLPGLVHVSTGQEAIAVGVCGALRTEDVIVGNHRSHGHSLAKGASPFSLMAELMGRLDGCCQGYGGSMHVTDVPHGMLACTAIVGGQFSIAGGAAMSFKLRHLDNVAVCFFGDGALGQGAFFETLNMASKWQLPLILVCENNLYGMSTRYETVQQLESCADLASAYHVWGARLDGNDVLAVRETTQEAVARARRGDGPSILDCLTYRWTGHGVGDPGVYRTAEEVAAWKQRDPIAALRGRLISEGWIPPSDLEQIDLAAQVEIAEAIAAAEASPRHEPQDAWAYLYSEPMLEVYRRWQN